MTTQAQIIHEINTSMATQAEKTQMAYFERHVWGNDGLPMSVKLTHGGADLEMTVVGAEFTGTVQIGPYSGNPHGTTSQSLLDQEITKHAVQNTPQGPALAATIGDVFGSNLPPSYAYNIDTTEYARVMGSGLATLYSLTFNHDATQSLG
jgi:hypothetical protein